MVPLSDDAAEVSPHDFIVVLTYITSVFAVMWCKQTYCIAGIYNYSTYNCVRYIILDTDINTCITGLCIYYIILFIIRV